MNDEFYATIKLITGEEVLGYINLFDDGLTIQDALLLEDMSMFENILDDVQSKGIKLSRWIKSSVDNIQYIKDNKIVTICELKEPGLTHYKKALSQLNKTEKKLVEKKREKYNGHRSTVKEARIKFEKLFKDY